MGNRGSISIYWVIVIFLILELVIFALNISSKNFLLASSKEAFQEESIYMDNLAEQTKYVGYKLVEDTAIYAKNYTEYMMDTLDRDLSYDELEKIYDESLGVYLNRRLKLTNQRGDSKVGSREELRLEGYPDGYEFGERNLRVRIVEQVEVGDGRKRFKMVYEHCQEGGGVEYSSVPIVLELSYPSYGEMISGDMGEAVCVYMGNNYSY